MITLNNTKKNSRNIFYSKFYSNLTNEFLNKEILNYTIYYYVR